MEPCSVSNWWYDDRKFVTGRCQYGQHFNHSHMEESHDTYDIADDRHEVIHFKQEKVSQLVYQRRTLADLSHRPQTKTVT
jgi:hypothetical protein